MRKAEVFCHDIKAGILTEEVPGKNYTFTYEKLYLADASHEPISVTMSLTESSVHLSCSTYWFTIH